LRLRVSEQCKGHNYNAYTKARNDAKTETRRAITNYEKEVAKLANIIPKAFHSRYNANCSSQYNFISKCFKEFIDKLTSGSELL